MQFAIAMMVVAIISALVSFFFMKPPQPPNQDENSVEIPDTKIGTPIGVLFGRRMIKEPKVAWWGEVKIVKVKVSSDSKK